MSTNSPTSTPNLTTVLDLARARTLVLRDIDVPLGGHHGLGLNDLAVLLELKAAPAWTLRRVELARRLAVTTSGIARQLAPLERIGLVAREPDLMDARLALVVLTPRGAEVAEEARATAEEAAAHALRNVWPEDELEALAPLLRRASAGPVRSAD
jgi:DNA-binding MarR family transcriptional regulator